LEQVVYDCKQELQQSLALWKKIFCFKTFHAAFMTASWLNIAGRAFITNPMEDFVC